MGVRDVLFPSRVPTSALFFTPHRGRPLYELLKGGGRLFTRLGKGVAETLEEHFGVEAAIRVAFSAFDGKGEWGKRHV